MIGSLDNISFRRFYLRAATSDCLLIGVSALGCREVGFIGKHGQNPEVSLISREPNLRFERISISRGFLCKSFSSFSLLHPPWLQMEGSRRGLQLNFSCPRFCDWNFRSQKGIFYRDTAPFGQFLFGRGPQTERFGDLRLRNTVKHLFLVSQRHQGNALGEQRGGDRPYRFPKDNHHSFYSC